RLQRVGAQKNAVDRDIKPRCAHIENRSWRRTEANIGPEWPAPPRVEIGRRSERHVDRARNIADTLQCRRANQFTKSYWPVSWNPGRRFVWLLRRKRHRRRASALTAQHAAARRESAGSSDRLRAAPTSHHQDGGQRVIGIGDLRNRRPIQCRQRKLWVRLSPGKDQYRITILRQRKRDGEVGAAKI